MIKRLLCLSVVLTVLMAVPSVSFARLGETEDELIERFGQPVSDITAKDQVGIADKILMFKKGDTVIHATIYKGQCVSEGYQFMDSNGNEVAINGAALEKADAALGANAAGFRWQKHPNPSAINPDMLHAWNRTDGAVAAIVWRNKPSILEINSMRFIKEDNEAKRAAAAGSSGF